MPEVLDELFGYWRHFAREVHEVDGARVLQNPRLPIVEANAAYLSDPRQVDAVLAWFGTERRLPCLVTPTSPLPNSPLTGFLVPAPLYSWERAAPRVESDVWVEQVPWTSGDAIASVILCDQGVADWQPVTASEIGRVLRETQDATSYVALEDGRVVGTLVRIGFRAHLVAARATEPDTVRALLVRAELDAGTEIRSFSTRWLSAVPVALLWTPLEW